MKRICVVSGMLAAAAFLAGCQQMPQKAQASALTPPPPMQASLAQPPQVQPQTSQAQQAQAQQAQRRPAQRRGASPAAQQARVDFRLAQPAKAAGLSELKFPDGSLWYNPQPVLTRADLAGVEPRRSADGHPYIRFRFSAMGAQKLAALTRQHPGKLLVLTLNNSLESVYPIGQPVQSGVLDIGVKSDQEAVAAVKKIAGQ